ncbi:MAG: hypothetical protein WKF71_09910 [Pyrinomonadaceae bacterium]
MSQTLEAIVSETGEISLLKEIRLEKPHRALVTILDEEPKELPESKKEKLFAAFEKLEKADVFSDIENPVEWQRNLRNEWD